MEQADRPSAGEASASEPWETAVPFPPRLPEFSGDYPHGENQGSLINNDGGSSAIRDDPKSCLFASTTFSFFAMTMAFGLYGSENLQLGPNTSILIKPNHIFVESIKVEALNEAQGSILYGFYDNPPLDVTRTWSETHKIILPPSTHKEWVYYLNKGSQINISYGVDSLSSSSLVLVILEGDSGHSQWLKDPSYPNTTVSWSIIHGNGSIQKDIPVSSIYYIAVGNLNGEVIKVHLHTGMKAFLYNTTEPYYKCAPAEGQCTFQLFFRGKNAAVLTSPSRMPGMISGDWYVKLSYGPRWISYLVGIGGITLLLLLLNNLLNHLRCPDQETPRHQPGDTGSERTPLLTNKDDNISRDSSYASLSEDEGYVENSQAGFVLGGKPVRDEEDSRRLCAICFDAPRDSFFLPCGHCVACFGCATRIVETSGACPICRRRSKKARKIYTV